MGAEMFRTDKKDGHHKPNSRFSQFCERASKLHIFHSFIITRNLVPTIQEERENWTNYWNYEWAKQNIDTDIFVNFNWVDTRWQ